MPGGYFTCNPSDYLLLTYASVSEVDITDLANDTGTPTTITSSLGFCFQSRLPQGSKTTGAQSYCCTLPSILGDACLRYPLGLVDYCLGDRELVRTNQQSSYS